MTERDAGISRRVFVVRAAQVGLAATSLPLFLQACAQAGSSAAPTKSASAATAAGKPVAAGASASATGEKFKIGFALPTLAQYRWSFDQQYSEEAVAALGDELIVQAGNDDEQLQASQVENIDQPRHRLLGHRSRQCRGVIHSHRPGTDAGVKTVSYNYVARDTEKLDYWVARDNVLVGHVTAEEGIKAAPTGNYVMCSGDGATRTLPSTQAKGYMETLQPLIDKGDIVVVSQAFNKNWDPALGLKQIEDALTKTNNDIAAILCNYDGFALSALQALKEQNLLGKVFIGGEDVFPECAQAIVEGNMNMSSYTDLKEMATKAAQAAHDLAAGQAPAGQATLNNGAKDVPGDLISSYAVTAENMPTFIADTGWVEFDETYKNVPADQRPSPMPS